MKINFKIIRDRIQKRYQLDVATANETTSLLMKDDFKRNKIVTTEQAMNFLDHLEELGEQNA